MADSFTYQKKRKEFGRQPQFEDTDVKIVGSIPPNPNQGATYHVRNPNKIVLSNIPQMSCHSVSINFCGFINLNFIGQHRKNSYWTKRYEARCGWMAQ